MDNLAEESESFPNGFSTITLDHPEGDMHVFLIAVVTDSNTDGGKAEEKKKIISSRGYCQIVRLLGVLYLHSISTKNLILNQLIFHFTIYFAKKKLLKQKWSC